MKKIIFLNQETGPLLIDIINVFANNGYNVVLYTGEVIKFYAHLDERVNVRKLCRYNKKNNLYRIFSWFLSEGESNDQMIMKSLPPDASNLLSGLKERALTALHDHDIAR